MSDSKLENQKQKRKPGRQPGTPKTGGRVKGSTNNSFYIREALNNAGVSLADEVAKLLDSAPDWQSRYDVIKHLLSFAYPQLTPAEPPTKDPLQVVPAPASSLLERLNKDNKQ